jgi:hypothetical protein
LFAAAVAEVVAVVGVITPTKYFQKILISHKILPENTHLSQKQSIKTPLSTPTNGGVQIR